MSTEATPLTAEELAEIDARYATATTDAVWATDVRRLLATLDRERAEHAALRAALRRLRGSEDSIGRFNLDPSGDVVVRLDDVMALLGVEHVWPPDVVQGRGICADCGAYWPCDYAVQAGSALRAALAAASAPETLPPLDVTPRGEHGPWARAVFAEGRLWLACECGWNAFGDADGTYNEHIDRASPPSPSCARSTKEKA